MNYIEKAKSIQKYKELIKTDWINQFDSRKQHALELALSYNIEIINFVKPEYSAEDIFYIIEVFQEERSY